MGECCGDSPNPCPHSRGEVGDASLPFDFPSPVFGWDAQQQLCPAQARAEGLQPHRRFLLPSLRCRLLFLPLLSAAEEVAALSIARASELRGSAGRQRPAPGDP